MVYFYYNYIKTNKNEIKSPIKTYCVGMHFLILGTLLSQNGKSFALFAQRNPPVANFKVSKLFSCLFVMPKGIQEELI